MYGKFLRKQKNQTVEAGLQAIKNVATGEDTWWIRMIGITTLMDLEDMYKNRIHVSETELKDLKAGDEKELDLRNAIDADTNTQKKIETLLQEIKDKEENPRLQSLLGGQASMEAHDEDDE